MTLVELLIVMAILATIIGVLLPNFNEVRLATRDNRRKQDMKAIAQALELYKINQSTASYPGELSITPGNTWLDNGVTYMKAFPKDPLYDTPNGAATFFYRYYRNSTDNSKYYLGACIEDIGDPDAKTTNPAGWIGCDQGKYRWYYITEP